MAKYGIGDKVISSLSNLKGSIVNVYPKRPGRQLYDVVFDDGTQKSVLESTLLPCADITDPFDCCAKGIYGSASDFSCMNTTFKLKNTSNNTISSLKASKTIFKAYQFKPLLKFLNSNNRRILVADEVGLGKTVEAGHIMLEMSGRGELNNALVICPKSLQEKWRDELYDKFGFQFKIYEAKDLKEDIQKKEGSVKAIINYEKIRESKSEDSLLAVIESAYRSFDFVLCDEAHRLRNQDTLVHRGVKRLLDSPCSAVFLTATPVMISERNLFNLLNLLDPEQYSQYDVFENIVSANTPFVQAITRLNEGQPLEEILEDLANAEVSTSYTAGDEFQSSYLNTETVDELFHDSPLYQRIVSSLQEGDRSPAKVVSIQSDLSAMSPMNNVFSRTRKKEITTDWTQAERDTYTAIVTLEEDEQAHFDAVIEEYSKDKELLLGLIQKKRQVSSSVYAYLNSDAMLMQGIDQYESLPDAKVNRLVEIAKEVEKNGGRHLIVFAIFKKTLRYLAIRLAKLGYRTIQIHGDIPSKDRFKLLAQFKNADSFTILLSSEVGSEGLDMQFCNSMVNYDLPWNPMVVEQRIGRVDRFGQKSPKVHIYNLVVKDSIQVDIYERLLDRIGIFKNCIGDLEAILDKDLEKTGYRNIQEWFTSLERELYCNEYTPEERREKLDSIARALETEKKNLNDIEEGLTNTLTNDLYFKKEIEALIGEKRYVTEEELINYLSFVILKEIPACRLEPSVDQDHVYYLRIPHSEPRLLTSFMEKYCPASLGVDQEILNRQFKSFCVGKTDIALTFNQDTAYENPELVYINAYHPLITAAFVYLNGDGKLDKKAYNFAISSNLIPASAAIGRELYMGIYIIRYERRQFGKTKLEELLTPVLYDLASMTIVQDAAVVNAVFSETQSNPFEAYLEDAPLDPEVLVDMKIDMETAILEKRKTYIDNLLVVLESNKLQQKKQITAFYDTRIRQLEETYRRHMSEIAFADETRKKNIQRILPIDSHNIEEAKMKKEEELTRIGESGIIEKEHQLLSICRINLN